MQSVEISGLKEIQKKLEGYPEAMKKARSEFFEEAGREMLSTVRRRIGGQGYVANVQDRHVGSGGGYAAVRAKAKTELRGYAAGYVTNALEGGHVQTPGRYVPAMGKKLKAKISKTKESVPRCRAMMEDSKLVSTKGTGSIRIYNATSRLIELEGEALKTGKDLRHTIISNLDDPDNPNNQRIALMGVSFDDLTLADWEAAKLGQIESPFTFNDYQMLDT